MEQIGVFHSMWNLRTIPRIRQPTTYSEWILHRKFYCPFTNSALYSDKFRVRDYVGDPVGDHVLNEVYCAAKSPDLTFAMSQGEGEATRRLRAILPIGDPFPIASWPTTNIGENRYPRRHCYRKCCESPKR